VNFVEQRRHHLVMEMSLISICDSKRRVEEIDRGNHTSGDLDICRT